MVEHGDTIALLLTVRDERADVLALAAVVDARTNHQR